MPLTCSRRSAKRIPTPRRKDVVLAAIGVMLDQSQTEIATKRIKRYQGRTGASSADAIKNEPPFGGPLVVAMLRGSDLVDDALHGILTLGQGLLALALRFLGEAFGLKLRLVESAAGDLLDVADGLVGQALDLVGDAAHRYIPCRELTAPGGIGGYN